MILTTKSRPAALTASVLGLAFVLAGCGAADEPEPQEEPQEEVVEETAEAEETAEEDDAPAESAGEAVEIPLDVTFSDPDMGDEISILGAVRGFPSEENADVYEDGGEIVLVEVEVAPGDEFGGAISVGAFAISWDDGADFWNNDTRHVEEEMAEAGYPALEDVRRMDGETGTGWVAFFVDEVADTYIVEYERRAASVIGSDEEIDAFVETFEIPSA